ncbi:MAG: hypothetical protein ACI4U2_02015, partial [Christensenellaceae bacterium]
MSFTTIAFIVFFAVVLVVYYLVPKKVQWMWLLAASIFFYMYTLWWGIFFLIGTVAFTYALARLIDRENALVKERLDRVEDKSRKKEIKAKGERTKRLYVILGVLGLVLLLVVMRYTNLAVEAIEKRFSVETGVPSLIMPIGLSFYVFQTIGYLVDVGRGTYPAERNFLKFLLYIAYFPHVLQGPLDDYQTVSEALYAPHTFDETASANGIRRALWGFFKKLVIANQSMMIISSLLATGGNGDGLTSFVVLLLYALWIYADFSGYMDIAIGCSTMLGIPIAENFDSPYLSGDIAEYWRRW